MHFDTSIEWKRQTPDDTQSIVCTTLVHLGGKLTVRLSQIDEFHNNNIRRDSSLCAHVAGVETVDAGTHAEHTVNSFLKALPVLSIIENLCVLREMTLLEFKCTLTRQSSGNGRRYV